MSNDDVLSSSFRDPSGFLFYKDGVLYRQINNRYALDYNHLMEEGLYQALIDDGLIIPHDEVSLDFAQTPDACKVIKPQPINFISYPYEWCFSQLKDAALTTLAIQKKAFEFGMTLKDSTAYNIQFIGAKPVLIDTLSFEKYTPGQPWTAYQQFCRHFLAPLAMASFTDIRLTQLARIHIDGTPLDLASKTSPAKTHFKPSILMHIHKHAKVQVNYSDKQVDVKARKISTFGFRAIIDSLESATTKLKWQPAGTEWGDYYDATNYSEDAMGEKEKLVADFLARINPKTTWDLGANTGLFSRIASRGGSKTVAFDIDPAAVEKNYLQAKANKQQDILPLVLDLTNPSSAIGFDHTERMSIAQRGPVDAILALALVHHLAISNNLPLEKIARSLASLTKNLIIEFVPKEDSQVKRLLATREDIFPDYTQAGFEAAFSCHFSTHQSVQIKGTHRLLYRMQAHDR